MGRHNTQQVHVHPTTMAGDNAQRNRERDEMAKTDHQSTRDLNTNGEQSKPRPLSVQRIAHHVTDLQEMGIYEAQALGTMDSPMGIAADVLWDSRAGSRTSLVATLALFGILEKPTNASDRVCDGHLQMLRPNGQITRLHDCESCWHSYVNIMEALRIRNSKTVDYGAPHTRRRGIPQGCSFFHDAHRPDGQTLDNSVQKRGAIPRVLADDFHLVAAGERHYETYLEAIRDTHIFITTAGGRIAASKSYAFSTDRRTRKRLHNIRYDIPCGPKPIRTISGVFRIN